ncbi:MAG: NAD(P)-dependent oxidoreductase [Granulosicoccus sp.]
MSVLVVGASGATGRLLVEQLLDQGETVKAVVRSTASLPERLTNDERLIVTEASLLDMTDEDLEAQILGCHAVASCLGHNISFKGIFGHPRRLVTDSVKRLCKAIEKTDSAKPIKFVLMNTTGNQNRQAGEKITFSHNIVVSLLRCILPPHADNEHAAEFLQSHYSASDNGVEWVAVRPDALIDEEAVTPYNVFESPVRDPIFDSGKTSRINVAGFMAKLIVNDNEWKKWQGHMPVVYNA